MVWRARWVRRLAPSMQSCSLPHMLRIVEGAPEERRRYLNLSLGQVMPRYAADLAEYQRLLAQRNALLKLLNERGGDPGQLTYWDDTAG